jgi:hypothetical protein
VPSTVPSAPLKKASTALPAVLASLHKGMQQAWQARWPPCPARAEDLLRI